MPRTVLNDVEAPIVSRNRRPTRVSSRSSGRSNKYVWFCVGFAGCIVLFIIALLLTFIIAELAEWIYNQFVSLTTATVITVLSTSTHSTTTPTTAASQTMDTIETISVSPITTTTQLPTTTTTLPSTTVPPPTVPPVTTPYTTPPPPPPPLITKGNLLDKAVSISVKYSPKIKGWFKETFGK